MPYVGIDLGGTSIKAGLVSEDGVLLARASAPTRVAEGFEAIVRDIVQLAHGVATAVGLNMRAIGGIGVGLPGLQNIATGRVAFCNNLGWRDVPLLARLEEELRIRCVVENDAAVAALAESIIGASRNARDSVLLTLGTGLGGGVILNGALHTGAHGVGVEMGHMVLSVNGRRCTCGQRGCWECYASAGALARAGVRGMRAERGGALWQAARGRAAEVTPRMVVDLAKAGDKTCRRIFDRYVTYLSAGMASLVNAFDPEVIVLGGGLSLAGDFLLDAVRAELKRLVFCSDMAHAEVRLAELGNDAGIVGAALLAR